MKVAVALALSLLAVVCADSESVCLATAPHCVFALFLLAACPLRALSTDDRAQSSSFMINRPTELAALYPDPGVFQVSPPPPTTDKHGRARTDSVVLLASKVPCAVHEIETFASPFQCQVSANFGKLAYGHAAAITGQLVYVSPGSKTGARSYHVDADEHEHTGPHTRAHIHTHPHPTCVRAGCDPYTKEEVGSWPKNVRLLIVAFAWFMHFWSSCFTSGALHATEGPRCCHGGPWKLQFRDGAPTTYAQIHTTHP